MSSLDQSKKSSKNGLILSDTLDYDVPETSQENPYRKQRSLPPSPNMAGQIQFKKDNAFAAKS